MKLYSIKIDTENIKLVFCAVKDTIMQSALRDSNLAWKKFKNFYVKEEDIQMPMLCFMLCALVKVCFFYYIEFC